MPTTEPAAAFQPQRYAPRIWGHMPARIKVLHVTTLERTGGWLAEAFAADAACDIRLEEALGIAAGLAQLREQVFDAVLVSHEPGLLDALDLVEGLRAGGHDEPMIILGSEPSADVAPLAYEVGADAYCCVAETATRSLLWTFARAIERTQLIREHRRFAQTEQQRLAQEQQEADRLLAQQRSLIAELELIRAATPAAACGLADPDTNNGVEAGTPRSGVAAHTTPRSPFPTPHSPLPTLVSPLPSRLVAHYRELLRAYVVMGAGNLADEMTTLAGLLVGAGVSAQSTMQLHVQVLEELIASLGNRSARHVMSRADLLVLEVMAHLADGYRRRYDERLNK